MKEPPLKIITAKSSINGINWKKQYKKPLMQLVSTVNSVVAHTYAFLKFFSIHEIADNDQFVLKDYINDSFFKEVFLSLVGNYKPTKQKQSENAQKLKELVLTYRQQYLQLSSYVPVTLKYNHQIPNYESVKLLTTYKDNVILQFGNMLRRFLNILLKRKDITDAIQKEMKELNKTEDEIEQETKRIADRIKSIKMDVSSGKIEDINHQDVFLSSKDMDMLQSLFQVYPKE